MAAIAELKLIVFGRRATATEYLKQIKKLEELIDRGVAK